MANRLLLMAVLPIVVATFSVLDWSAASAQGFSYGSGYSYPYDVPVYNNRFNGGNSFGYVYDPYASGRFKAPDLLNDPLFQAQHKFDSHFPGRYSPQDRVKYYHSQPSPRSSGGFFRALRSR